MTVTETRPTATAVVHRRLHGSSARQVTASAARPTRARRQLQQRRRLGRRASISRSTQAQAWPAGIGPAHEDVRRRENRTSPLTDTNGITEHTSSRRPCSRTTVAANASACDATSVLNGSPRTAARLRRCRAPRAGQQHSSRSGNVRRARLTASTCTHRHHVARPLDDMAFSIATGGILGGPCITDPATATGAGPGQRSGDEDFIDGHARWLKHTGRPPARRGNIPVCRTHNLNSNGTPPGMVDITPDVCTSVLDNDASDADKDAGQFQMNGLILGRYTIHETAAPAGYTLDLPDTETVDLTITNPSNADNVPRANRSGVRRREAVQDDHPHVRSVDQRSDRQSTVTLTGFVGVKDTLATPPAGIAAAQLCGLGGASYGDLNAGTYNPSVLNSEAVRPRLTQGRTTERAGKPALSLLVSCSDCRAKIRVSPSVPDPSRRPSLPVGKPVERLRGRPRIRRSDWGGGARGFCGKGAGCATSARPTGRRAGASASAGSLRED